MSTQQQIMKFCLQQSKGQVGQIPNLFQDGEETDPLHLNQAHSLQQSISTRQQTIKREHTAPKVLLSVMHKILYWQPNTTNYFKTLLSEINKNQNNSTPIKFYILASKANLIDKLRNQFSKDAQIKLNNYVLHKNWSERRLDMATQWKVRIEMALRESTCKKAFGIIWKDNNHPGRQAESKQSVASFKKKIIRKSKSKFVKS